MVRADPVIRQFGVKTANPIPPSLPTPYVRLSSVGVVGVLVLDITTYVGTISD